MCHNLSPLQQVGIKKRVEVLERGGGAALATTGDK
jgi:hypothetical protein